MIDLHTHSTASDGSDSPSQLVAKAAAAGLSAVALTDHDTVEGLGEARRAAATAGIRLVPGCEISCPVERGTMHVVVLFLEDEGPLQDRLGDIQAGRGGRNARIVEALRSAGVDVTLEEIEDEAGDGSVGRPHIAAVLVRKGAVSSIQEAFDVWLAKGKPAYFERERLETAEALALARASGGVSVLAHPLSLDRPFDELDALVASLADLGLDGIEVEYGRYSEDERARLGTLAERHGLCPSGGSDYHGTYKPDLELGVGRGDLSVPDGWLDSLEARRPGA